MLRLLLLAACAAPAAALPFGFGRRKGEVLASLHEIEADLADLETETVPATNTVPVAATNTVPVPPCGELPLATSFTPPRTHVVTFKAGLTPASPSPEGVTAEGVTAPLPYFCFDFKCGAPPQTNPVVDTAG